MRFRGIWTALGVVLLLLLGPCFLSQCRNERGVWIDTRSADGHRTTIALTENLVRQYVDSRDTDLNFSGDGKAEPVTKEMLRDLLDGRRHSIEQHNDGGVVRVTMRSMAIPGGGGGGDELVVETYKNGERTFHLTLPDIGIDRQDENDGADELVHTSFGWKRLLPFLSKEGGAIYINDEEERTEVWIYVE